MTVNDGHKLVLEHRSDFMDGEGKELLYIGARSKKFSWSGLILEAGYNISILEIFEPNVKTLRSFNFITEVYHDDIVTTKLDKKFDVVLWHAGPEHVTKEDFEKAAVNIDRICTKVSILICPDGERPQGKLFDNKWERHVAVYEAEDFEKHGYIVLPYTKGKHKYLLAIKHFDKE